MIEPSGIMFTEIGSSGTMFINICITIPIFLVLRQGLVIASHRILWDAITYPCLRYLLLASKSSNKPLCVCHKCDMSTTRGTIPTSKYTTPHSSLLTISSEIALRWIPKDFPDHNSTLLFQCTSWFKMQSWRRSHWDPSPILMMFYSDNKILFWQWIPNITETLILCTHKEVPQFACAGDILGIIWGFFYQIPTIPLFPQLLFGVISLADTSNGSWCIGIKG